MSSPPEVTDFVPGNSRYGRQYKPSLKARDNLTMSAQEASDRQQAIDISHRDSEDIGREHSETISERAANSTKSYIKQDGHPVLSGCDEKFDQKKPENDSIPGHTKLENHDTQSRRSTTHSKMTKHRSDRGSTRSSARRRENQRLENEARVKLAQLKVEEAQIKLELMKAKSQVSECSESMSQCSTTSRVKSKLTKSWVQDHQGQFDKSPVGDMTTPMPNNNLPDSHPEPDLNAPIMNDFTPNCQISSNDGAMDWINCLKSRTVHNNPQNFQPTTPAMGALCMDFSNLSIKKKFSGSPLDWVEWSLAFKNKVHDNQFLTKSQKLSLLQESIGEGPKNRIFGLLWDSKNYEAALQRLQSLYGNKNLIVDSYISEVRGWKPKNNQDLDVTDFSVLITKLVQVFDALGFHADLKGQALLNDLTSKLSPNQKKSWGKFIQRNNGNQNVSLFESWLAREEEALRLGGATHSRVLNSGRASAFSSFSVNTNEIRSKTFSRSDTPRVSPNSESYSSNTNRSSSCVFCKSDSHVIDACTEFCSKSHADRLKWYVDERRCFRCSKPRHRADACLSRNRCRVDNCGRRHVSVLHDALNEHHQRTVIVNETETDTTGDNIDTPSQAPNVEIHEQLTSYVNEISAPSRVYLQVVKVQVHSPDGLTATTHALLDPGSQASLISNDLANKLELRGPSRRLTIKNVVQNAQPTVSKSVSFMICDPCDMSKPPIHVSQAWTLDSLNLPSQTIPRDDQGSPIWEHIRDLQIPDIKGSEIGLLIGVSCKDALCQLGIRHAPQGLPDAILTPLGWCLMGGITTHHDDQISENACSLPEPVIQEGELQHLIEKFWSVDDLGSKFSETEELSMEDRQALHILESKTSHSDPSGRYEVPMLWRETSPKLKDNRKQAEARYLSLRSQLLRNEDKRKSYTDTMSEYIEKGYLKKLDSERASISTDITRYLVHFGVTHPFKKKIRVVMDAALPYQGKSLNDSLLMGPFLTNSLLGLILRFRRGKIVLSSDIESMFYRVLVPTDERHALRVLYSETLDKQPDTYEFECHVFGASCSPSCATYALKRTAHDNAEVFPENVIREVQRSFYVDDFLTSVNDETEAIELTQNIIRLLATGGFKLTKWQSTSKAVLQAATATIEGIATDIDLDLDNSPLSRVLGVHWQVKEDTLTFRKRKQMENVIPSTKRSLLSLVCSIFDPLGLLAPYTIRARILIQNLWAEGVEWDETLPEKIASAWRNWLSEIDHIENFTTTRKYWPSDHTSVQTSLHIFCDSSENAYAAVCYLRSMSESGDVHVALVASRSRVAPMGKKKLSIPRLELQAAVLAVRLSTTVQQELDLKIEYIQYWSDSVIVLQYLANEKRRFKTFVGNRVAEIRSASDPDQWRHCPGHQNPSDLATRGTSLHDLTSEHSIWLHGPKFLCKTESAWPAKISVPSINESDTETRAPFVGTTETETSAFIDPCDVSSLNKLIHITVYCLRFVYNCRNKSRISGHPSPSEIQSAKNFWLKRAQHESYSKEIEDLHKRSQVSPVSGLAKLFPIIDESSGLLRVGGRVSEAKISHDAKHQVILSPTHRVTELIAIDCHIKLLHAGTEHTVNSMRQTYWIPSLRPLVKRVIRNCPPCIRENAKPAVPRMASLPLARVEEGGVWTHTGMDVFGPILIKERRSRVKRWVVMFCSMTIRAIHMEIIRTVDSDCFIQALRRLIARRGEIKHLYSDSGSNFVGAAPELRAAVHALNEDEHFRNYLTATNIEFHFMPPKASHFGGSWERLIKSIKRTFRIVFHDRVLHEDTLHTSLCEIESAMNSRPLSYVGDDPSDPTSLTPNHFLHHASTTVTPPTLTVESDALCRKRWRQSQIVTQHLWKRWRMEYLPSLTIAHKWLKENRPLKNDDVVLIVDHNAPRGSWPLARIVDVNVSHDGRVRSAKLKTKSGFLVRPASAICLLESSSSQP